jgi:hypothetical protein
MRRVHVAKQLATPAATSLDATSVCDAPLRDHTPAQQSYVKDEVIITKPR